MALYDLTDPAVPLPSQIVVDSSLLLALRPCDDNPNAAAIQGFVRRLRRQIAAYQMVAWLLMPVLQECCHVILTNRLRRAWVDMEPVSRPPNWMVMYKRQYASFHYHLPPVAAGCVDPLRG